MHDDDVRNDLYREIARLTDEVIELRQQITEDRLQLRHILKRLMAEVDTGQGSTDRRIIQNLRGNYPS